MKFFAVSAALVSVLPSVMGQLTVNTVASIVQCQPIQFTWSGGTPPYFLSLLPAGQPSAAALKQFPTQEGTSYTWTVDLASGSTFSISLKDSTGAVAYSDIETVNAGPDSSCLNASVTEGSASSTPAASGASTGLAAVSTPAAVASTSLGASAAASSVTKAASASAAAASGSASKSASASASASSAAKSNAAVKSTTMGTFGIAGLMGLVGAALF